MTDINGPLNKKHTHTHESNQHHNISHSTSMKNLLSQNSHRTHGFLCLFDILNGPCSMTSTKCSHTHRICDQNSEVHNMTNAHEQHEKTLFLFGSTGISHWGSPNASPGICHSSENLTPTMLLFLGTRTNPRPPNVALCVQWASPTARSIARPRKEKGLRTCP